MKTRPMTRLPTILRQQRRSIRNTDRFRLTPAGVEALLAADLHRQLPELFAAVDRMVGQGYSPGQIHDHLTSDGWSEALTGCCEAAARFLTTGTRQRNNHA